MAKRIAGAGPDLSFPIAMIGASAGGLEAFTQLLKGLPAKPGMAFVLIQHLEPKHESALTKILSRATSMPVLEVSGGMPTEPNHVYVIPPNRSMTIRRGILQLMPRAESSGQYHPIDDFALALAHDRQSAAIGVVLSGNGSDGTLGLKAIKVDGGITFAQDPQTTRSPGMPMSAIWAGSVDFVLTPNEIAAKLARIGRHPHLLGPLEAADGELDNICQLLRAATGVDFRLYKQATVGRRVARRMAVQKIASLKRYAQFIKKNPVEAAALADDIFIHVTGFFRDPECFQALRRQVFPRLRFAGPAGDAIRIWVPGCSTGEEVYSIAMLLLEDLDEQPNRTKIQMFGTDISDRAVEHARAGSYSEAALAGVSPGRLKRFFTKGDYGYQIHKSVRDMCVFARHDLAKDPPFSNLDLISCRNVLIYMGAALQKRTLSIFQYALRPGRFLFLGKSEFISACPDAFGVESRKHKLFSRKPPAAPAYRFHPPGSGIREQRATLPRAPQDLALDFRKEAEQVLMERYTPPALVVDADLQIVHFQGDTSRFLAPATGRPSFHLLKLLRPEFVVDLRAAVQKARKDGVTARTSDALLKHEGGYRAVHLEVNPLPQRQGREPDFLVVFEETEPAPAERGRQRDRAREREKVAALERELASTREYVRSLAGEHEAAQEEMRATNEEILSNNEELQSTNEELETAQEELQSSNEELTTLNDELQNRNAEQNVLTNDLTNLLTGVDIPVLVLDGDLRIRRFTPVAETVLNLIPGDVGRPFSHIASNLDVTDWDKLLVEVTGHERSVEREVRDRNGNWYSLRMRPYRASDNRIDGVLVVLLDIDLVKRNAEIHALAARLLTAQEEERRRVSRELHDDLCQQLASLAFDIGGLAADMPSPDGAGTSLRALQQRVVKAAEEARHIAYQMHPSALDNLGLAVALEALCKELPQSNGTAVKFNARNLPDSVPKEIASCLYRVLQEGLRNIAKHSNAKHASVQVIGRKGSIVLSLEDDGVGFDGQVVKGRGGLGMVSMAERARIVNGKISVKSRPGHGARITLVVMLPGGTP
jgi:two-component system CheB/CheR fusion protein